MNALTSTQIKIVFDYVEELCGIALEESKAYLIDVRFASLIKRFEAHSVIDLIDKAKQSQGEGVRRAMIEAITTRETHFFRDTSVYDALQFKALPELLDRKLKRNSNKLRIWSAAASSGQEACSIGMVIQEMIPDIARWDVQILGTDISQEALAKGRKGIYSRLDIERGLPAHFVGKYMKPHPEGYRVADSILRMIRYQELNLLHPFQFQEPFDIIFCRNVAIYFEKRVKIDLFRRMLPILQKDGYLFVGVSESLFDCGPEFKPQSHCRGAFYQPHLTMQSLQPALATPEAKSPAAIPSSRPTRQPNLSPSPSKISPPVRTSPGTTYGTGTVTR